MKKVKLFAPVFPHKVFLHTFPRTERYVHKILFAGEDTGQMDMMVEDLVTTMDFETLSQIASHRKKNEDRFLHL